jgi:hypothetical protein
MLPSLHSDFNELTIDQLSLLFRHGQINLEPGFQRKSVWSTTDRRRLIQSVLSAYPVPSIFLYKRHLKSGRLIYDVIDGKQRLETIFMFTRAGRFKRQAFGARVDLGDGVDWYDWRDICRYYQEARAVINGYKLSTVEVTGDLAQIIDLFVRINSTGKRLTSGEKRHARFYDSPFLAEAQWLVNRHRRYLTDYCILSPSQLDRMKGTELVSELLVSIHHGGVINKKTALDKAIGNESINGNTLNHLSREFTATLNTIRRMLPHIYQTRFHNTVDFYTLFMLVWEFRDKGFILAQRQRNAMAERLLRKLSTAVDELRQAAREGRQIRNPNKLAQEYLPTVLGDTDSAATRERRAVIVRGLLSSLFDFKSPQRTFSAEQRRILWNRDDRPTCRICKKPLTWNDVSIDHVKAWAKGGPTSLKNAQLAHRACNSRKGAR